MYPWPYLKKIFPYFSRRPDVSVIGEDVTIVSVQLRQGTKFYVQCGIYFQHGKRLIID